MSANYGIDRNGNFVRLDDHGVVVEGEIDRAAGLPARSGFGARASSSPTTQYMAQRIDTGPLVTRTPDLEAERLVQEGERAGILDAGRRREARRKKRAEARVVAAPDYSAGRRRRILAIDPGRTRDRFAVAVIDVYGLRDGERADEVYLLVHTGVLPRKSRDGAEVDQPLQIEFIVSLVEAYQPDWLGVDGKGLGVGIVDSLRRAVKDWEPTEDSHPKRLLPRAERSVVDIQLGGGTGHGKLAKKRERWSIATGELVGLVGADIEHHRLIIDPALGSNRLAELQRQLERFEAKELPGGGFKFSSGTGAAVDDVLFAVLMAALLSRETATAASRLIAPPRINLT